MLEKYITEKEILIKLKLNSNYLGFHYLSQKYCPELS